MRLSARYNAGFSSVIDTGDDNYNSPPGEPVKYQNRVLQLSVCYWISELQF
jgi:hypothetical protein